MGKQRSNKSKRSLGSLPKGLVHRKGSTPDPGNPFEVTAKQKRPKHEVHNRPISKPKTTKHALENLQRRQTQLRSSLKSSRKSNILIDRRIGQYDPTMTREDQMLARLVKERTRQSHRVSKYRLDGDGDDDDGFLTHKGKPLDPNNTEAIYSDDEDDHGNLEAVDTELHFGGQGLSATQNDPYGGSSRADLSQVYGQRKTELDDLIARRKIRKAERVQAKESQVETVDKLDEGFAELSQLLLYRKDQAQPVKPKTPTKEDEEMTQWHQEMKQIMNKPKHRATDRTKTPQELAKEQAAKLHELETRRLARMNGDFEEDDFSDISVVGFQKKRRKKKKKSEQQRNPDELSESDDSDDDEDKLEARFTADGIKYVDKKGRVVDKKHDSEAESSDDSESDSDEVDSRHPLAEGARVRGNYRAEEQFHGHETWHDGVVTKVHKQPHGKIKYNVKYDDGDLEEDMTQENVRPVEKTSEEENKIKEKNETDRKLHFQRNKARDQARKEIPFVLEVPTTLEALNEMIANYATTGKDASTIIERIHSANSVRLDRRNGGKMQNFYDALLRRFVAVGDAYFLSGDGGEELGRYDQLTCLTKVMYSMAQDSPESAGAVWSRRIGIFQSAQAKRLRDSEFVHEEDDEDELVSAWPSSGILLLLSAMGHIFPVTDRRHYVVSPTILLLGQMVAQTPIGCTYDVVLGVLCAGLLLEYTKEAKRVVPEAVAFLAGVIRLYSPNPGNFAMPSFEEAYNNPAIKVLRDGVVRAQVKDGRLPLLKLEKDFITGGSPELSVAVLSASLDLIQRYTQIVQDSFSLASETELLSGVSESILSLKPKTFPEALQKKVADVASVIANACASSRAPLRRRAGPTSVQSVIKSLAPRMEDPERYSMSKDKGKKSVQLAIDRTRREYKREHKAISRELRLDAAFIEKERRTDAEKKDTKARAKRQKNFSWLEGEQASMNQQVREGGGLLKGGGMGAAREKAASAKLGIKKGGKF